MAPHHLERFRALIRGIGADRLSDRASTLEGRILEAMLGLTGEVEGGKLGVAAITDKINEGWPEKWHKSTKSVGRKLTALAFTRGRLAHGPAAIEYDIQKVGRLAERYGVRLPPAETSLLSQTSPPDTNESGGAGETSPNVTETSPVARYESDNSDDSDVFSTPRDTPCPHRPPGEVEDRWAHHDGGPDACICACCAGPVHPDFQTDGLCSVCRNGRQVKEGSGHLVRLGLDLGARPVEAQR
jgi:hypothetical protein